MKRAETINTILLLIFGKMEMYPYEAVDKIVRRYRELTETK